MQDLNHKHLLIRALVDKAPTDPEVMNKWVKEVVDAIDMKIVIEPRSFYVATEGNEGITTSCNIETSHLAAHIWSSIYPNRVEMDVYSCKDFEVDTILEKLGEWNPVHFHYMIVDRNGDEFKIIEQATLDLIELESGVLE